MDKRIGVFLKYSILVATIPVIIAVFAVVAQRSLSLSTFTRAMIVVSVIMLLLALIAAAMLLLVYSAYKKP